MYGSPTVWVVVAVAVVVIIAIFKIAVIVPQQSAYVIESLGKYSRTMRAGFPYPDSVYRNRRPIKHSLKEIALDIPGAGLYYQGQRAGRRRRRVVHAGAWIRNGRLTG